jgi:ribosome-associated toxin RatA of RatAB toxin-antitoxin module
MSRVAHPTPFSPEAVQAAPGPLVQIHLGPDGLPAAAIAATRMAATPARVWSVISDVGSYAGRVPMMERVRKDGSRVTVGLRFKVALFSVRFEFVADVRREEGRVLEIEGISGEPRGLRLRFDLTPLAGGAETMVQSTAEIDVLSLGWLAKYFLGHHPEIQHGILPGVALALLDSMRRIVEAEGRASRVT